MDIETIIANQRAFYESGQSRPLAWRQSALRKLREAVQENEDKINQALYLDLQKSAHEAYMAEIGLVLDEIRFHIKHLKGWMRGKRVPTPLAQFHSRSFTSPEPYGVVLIMAPWNYPVLLNLTPLIAAISAGNCAVVKPSAYAPASSQALAEMLGAAFPPEYIAVVQGSRKENSALLEQRFDKIFFTGSIEMGKVVMQAAARHLTPVTLELGGKSPAIVDDSANMRLAARRIAFGKLLNGGQTCVAPDYVLIQASKRDEFIAYYREALAQFFPDGDTSSMVRIVSQKHYLAKKALLEGQGIALGGETDDSKLRISPTLLIDVDPESPVMQEEIFGPILPVLTWEKLDEAIEFVRSRPKPLALYLFTESKAAEDAVLGSCSFGGGCINDTVIHLATPHMGFGGVGSSGMGQYHGKQGFDAFSHSRSIVRKSTWLDLPFRYLPYQAKNLRLIRQLMK